MVENKKTVVTDFIFIRNTNKVLIMVCPLKLGTWTKWLKMCVRRGWYLQNLQTSSMQLYEKGNSFTTV